MSISAGNIDFSKLFKTQATGNNGAAASGNVSTAETGQSQPQGAIMQQFNKDVDFSKLKLQ